MLPAILLGGCFPEYHILVSRPRSTLVPLPLTGYPPHHLPCPVCSSALIAWGVCGGGRPVWMESVAPMVMVMPGSCLVVLALWFVWMGMPVPANEGPTHSHFTEDCQRTYLTH